VALMATAITPCATVPSKSSVAGMRTVVSAVMVANVVAPVLRPDASP
jgi:hypothetical protein